MGIPGSANPMLFGGAVHKIEQSLRFNSADSAYLNRTPGSAGNRKTWTWSGWVKRAAISTTGANLFSVRLAASSRTLIRITGHALDIIDNDVTFRLTTNAVYRDPSAWYHFVVAFDTTESTSSDRLKIYTNGEQVTSFSTSTYPSLDYQSSINSTNLHAIGREGDLSNDYLDGYLAEVNFIDGSALDPTDFGEYDDNGVWRPIEYAGSYTGNSFYLKFASGDGTDSSGLSNTWTANNFTTSGTGTDVMSDTPTTNWCTLNPLDRSSSSPALSNGNLDIKTSTRTAQNESCRGTIGVSSGKWYFECVVTPVYSITFQAGEAGIKAVDTSLANRASDASDAFCFGVGGNGATWYKRTNSSFTSLTTSGATTGTVLSVAFDLDAGKIWVAKDGVWENSGNPASGTNAQFTSIASATYTAVLTPYSNDASTYTDLSLNSGQRAFAYTPPTGFKALNTSNLPAPDIADGSDYFNPKLYTGTGSTQSITGIGFQPDFTWAKRRDSANSHALFDAVRGAGERLSSNETTAEVDNTAYFTSFDSDGFSVALGGGETNLLGATYVAWNWLANGAGSSNTAGSITSTVSANPSAGFSIVSYTGTGANATVGHGLGVTPAMVIVKNRDTATSNGWMVKHQSLSSNYNISLNQTAAAWNPATNGYISNLSSSTTFGLTTGSVNADNVNKSGDAHIAYCFAEVEGYSKFGSYTGNGSSDGPFIYTGFRPALVLIKSTTSAENWLMFDSARGPYNANDTVLWPNLSNAEQASNLTPQDFLSNGFKLRTSSSAINGSGNTYIYMAFAENPFGGSGVSPATAR